MKKIFFYYFLLFFYSNSFAQTNDNIIQFISTKKINVNEKDSFKIITGTPAIIRQGTTLFQADSIYINDRLTAKYLEAFGKVYINESDSVFTYADNLKYYFEKKTATLTNNVTIKSSNGIFTSNYVDYDLNTKLATYKNGGKIVSKRTVLTSTNGRYFANTKDALFTDKVVLKGPEYDVITDSLFYNSSTEIANFVTYTKVINKKKKQTIETTRGFYNMQTGAAQFLERSKINDDGRLIQADNLTMDAKNKIYTLKGKASIVDKEKTAIAEEMYIDEKVEQYKLQGNASIVDKEKKETYRGQLIDLDRKNETYHIEGNGLYKNEKEGFVITGNYLDGDGKSGKSLATGKPVAIIKQENDSIFIAADTLYSGRIIKNKKVKTDSITKITRIDSLDKNIAKDTARYFEGFHHVRIFSDSVQAVCDSLYYSDVDSVFRLYQNPVVWNDKNQFSGDTMYLYTKNKKTSKVEVFEKGFVINIVQPNKFYNQIKSNKITGYFTDGNIDSLYAKGSAEIIFYIQDEDKAYIGVDKSSADIIIAYFENKEIYKIKWLNKYNGNTIPMKDANHETLRLRNFKLQENRRPKSKFELFF